MQNIDKSAFHRGQYVGYGGGNIWHICKAPSSYYNWVAWSNTSVAPIYARRLSELDAKLAALAKVISIPEIDAINQAMKEG